MKSESHRKFGLQTSRIFFKNIFSEYLHLQVAINMNYQSISTT